MPTSIPTTEPLALRAGDSATWRISLCDYPAGAGWVLSYALLSASAPKITFAAAADGDDHLVTLTAATTATWAAARYSMMATVSDGTDRATVRLADIVVLPDLTAAANYDGRSHARKMLEAIEAAIEARATNEQLDLIELTINISGASSHTSKRDRAALLEYRSKYRAEVAREDAASGNRPGRGRVLLRF